MHHCWCTCTFSSWYRSQQAFICNHDYHWLTVRKLGHQVCVVVWHGSIYFTFQLSIRVMPNAHVYNSPLSFSPPFTITAPLSPPLSSLPPSLLFFHVLLSTSVLFLPPLPLPLSSPPSSLSFSLPLLPHSSSSSSSSLLFIPPLVVQSELIAQKGRADLRHLPQSLPTPAPDGRSAIYILI